MKKKILSIALVVAMVAILAAGSFAYFTDKDKEINTFTVGNVKIDLIESQYHRVNAGKGNATGLTEPAMGGYLWAADVDLKGNVDNTPDAANAKWTGTYFSDDQIKADAETYKDGYFADNAKNMVPGDNVRKNPYVINTGANNAYIRVRVLVPVSLFAVLDNGPSYWTTTAMNEGAVTSKAVDYYMANGYKLDDSFVVERGDVQYYELDFTYTQALAPKAMTFWNVWGNIAIDKNATSEDLAKVDSFDVIFEADAIQAEGFANATAAFAAFDAQK